MGAGPLSGVRVLDLTSVVMGPFATQILGDLGADVICVESADGDTNRFMGPGPHPHLSGTALNLLRNKRNVVLDLRHPLGRDACLRLAATCDVLVTNLRPGSLGRLGLTYDEVAARRHDIVYCQAQGWPTDSDRADRPAYDDVIQSATGLADLFTLRSGEPDLVPTIVADKVAGLTIAYAVLAALVHRHRTGEGQRVEVAMVDAVGAFTLVEHAAAAIPVPPLGPAGYVRALSANRRPQRTADGWIHILPYSRENFVDVFRHGSRPDLADDPRLESRRSRGEHIHELYAEVAAITPRHTTSAWFEFCDDHDIPVGPVRTLEEVVGALPVAEHPVAGTYRLTPSGARFDRTPTRLRHHAPLLGEHDDEILREVGLSDDEIDALHDSDAISRP